MPLAILNELKQYEARVEARGNTLKIVTRKELPESLLEKLRLAKPKLIEELSQPPLPEKFCSICKNYNWWLSVYNVWVCGTCHPPASPELIKRTVSKDLKCADELLH